MDKRAAPSMQAIAGCPRRNLPPDVPREFANLRRWRFCRRRKKARRDAGGHRHEWARGKIDLIGSVGALGRSTARGAGKVGRSSSKRQSDGQGGQRFDRMRIRLDLGLVFPAVGARARPRHTRSPPPEFATIRLRLLKLGARVIETASRVRLVFAAACPDATLIRHVAAALMPTGP
jgi:hypothetical protein